MRLKFKTSNPTSLKNDIISLIEKGELLTWSIYQHDGEKYLKHTGQWGEKGVVKLTIDTVNSFLITEVIRFNGVTDRVEDFEGYYLGRFCELMFVNFPDRFTSIEKE